MHVTYPNVNFALSRLPLVVHNHGLEEDSRNGKVRSFPYVLTVTTVRPMERVLLCPVRRANPFLFLLDGLSILSSVDAVAPLANIVPRFLDYSDDKKTLRGHYGARLARQIPLAIQMLREDKNSRRVTLEIWRAMDDLGTESRDIPCNVHVNLRIRDNSLDLTVFNRSNDVFWGMLGANIVQFSFLQEYIAAMVGVSVGLLNQVSTNAHIYTEFGPGRTMLRKRFTDPTVKYPRVVPLDTYGLVESLDAMFRAMDEGVPVPRTSNKFLNEVVYPMYRAFLMNSADELEGDIDWFEAARMFLNGRD